MSRFTQPRRWAVDHKRHRKGQIAERDVSPEEARVGLKAAVLQCGFVFEEVLEYDPRRDVFQVEGRCQDGKLHQLTVPGGAVERLIIAARVLSGGPSDRRMVRHYELAAKV